MRQGMDNVAYIALSQQAVLQRRMNLVANNLANLDTAGFKSEQLLVDTAPGAPAHNDGIKGPALFVIDGGISRDFSQGEISITGRPLDVAINGDAMFKVQTPSGERYTRDGRFSVNERGQLVTSSGAQVLDTGGSPITLDPKNGDPSISADGVVSQSSPQGTSVQLGQIGLVRFDALGVLSKEGDGLYANSSNATPQAVHDVRMQQAALEGSNVKPIVEITNLIEVQRAYERTAQLIQQSNDLSQTSIDRLAKVS